MLTNSGGVIFCFLSWSISLVALVGTERKTEGTAMEPRNMGGQTVRTQDPFYKQTN